DPFDFAFAEFFGGDAEGVVAGGGAVVLVHEGEDAVAEGFELGEGLVVAVGGDEGGFADVAAAAEVPFSEVAGGVAGVVEGAGEGGGGGVEPLGHAAFFVGVAVVDEGGDAPALGPLAG